ncbi:MAG TPA: hypothetical protein VGY56_01025, partial [Verrucomicrobiae bacterium]|nr:hypothetical protein [Verrucomicrobiae bacterium]
AVPAIFCTIAGWYLILKSEAADIRCSIGKSDWPNEHFLEETNMFTREDSIKGTYSLLLGFRHVQRP